MSKCFDCNVNVKSSNRVCPLCNKKVKNKDKNSISYPKYIKNKNAKLNKYINIGIFLLTILLILINLLNTSTENVVLNYIFIICLFSFIIAKNILSSKISLGTKVIIIYFLVLALLVIIDIYNGFNRWSTTYVAPIMNVCVTIVFTFVALNKKNLFKEYIGYLIIVFFLTLIPLILYALSLSNSIWFSISSLIYFLLTIFIFLIFSYGNFKEEIKKRFNV
ncbi:MAG: DUF6320 domain-containing protein [Clostridia bacterium]